jgi:long-chain acyl-CoA synthetase
MRVERARGVAASALVKLPSCCSGGELARHSSAGTRASACESAGSCLARLARAAQAKPMTKVHPRTISRMFRRMLTGLLVLIACLCAQPLHAATLDGVTLPDRVAVGNKTLVLNGFGLRRATIFNVKVYLAGLYLESRSSNADQIMRSTQPKRLVLRLLHDAKRSQVAKAWREGLADNKEPLRPLESRLNELAAAMPDFKKGDQVTFDFASDSLGVTLNGGFRKTIPGRDFSRAMLGLWLGPSLRGDDLEARLLGK